MNLSSYKTRFFLLIGGLPVLLLLTWKLAFSLTLESYQELRLLRENSLKYPEPDRTLEQLKSELSLIRTNELTDHQTVDDILINAISDNIGKYHIQLEEFPENHSFTSNNFQIQTFRIRFSGRYANLLRFVHYAEYEIHICKLVSVDFQREVHRKKGEKLYMDLYFQSVNKTN